MPKKSEVASFVGNFSPVESRYAILVRRTRHFRGETGDELKTRAVAGQDYSLRRLTGQTFLEYRSTIGLHKGAVAIVVFLATVGRHVASVDFTVEGPILSAECGVAAQSSGIHP
jgi:hypothetical protein